MGQGPTCIAVIPARGGSKGLPKKNMCLLLGKPLIQYTLSAASESGVLDRIVVSSDDSSILDFAKERDVEALRRPDAISSDTASSDAVVQHLVAALELDDSDVIVFLQPTSPLRAAGHIQEAIEKFLSCPDTPLISVMKVDNTCLKSYVEIEGRLEPLYQSQSHRRQDLPSVYLPNGAIYIFTVEQFYRHKGIPREHIQPYVMSAEASFDIDSRADLDAAEDHLRRDTR